MTVDTPATSTELDAVNSMIGSIGMVPINTLSGTLTADITMARNILNEVSRAVQGKGWDFNTELEWPLALNGDNEIVLVGTIFRVDIEHQNIPNIATGFTKTPVAVKRGLRLYDKANHTYTWSAAVKATVIMMLAYDDLPEDAKTYIAMRAARKFQGRTIGSTDLDGFTSRDEFDALVNLNDAEGDTADHNIFDSYDVARVLDRGSSSSFAHQGFIEG